ncbi:hypothetical protein BT69DRAFT_1299315 [Atractiella rhizophila]|nr:hypothetical protein BT69DRAFT_1299315 [Atractiella rhizophila]
MKCSTNLLSIAIYEYSLSFPNSDARKTTRTGVKGVLADFSSGDLTESTSRPSFWTARPSSRNANDNDDDEAEEEREASSESEEEFRRPGKERMAGTGHGVGVIVGGMGKRTVALGGSLTAKAEKETNEEEEDGEEDDELALALERDGGKRSHLRHVTELSLLNRIDKGDKIILCIYDSSDFSTHVLNALANRIRSSINSDVTYLRLPSIALSSPLLELESLTDPDLLPCLVCYERGEVKGSEFRIGVDGGEVTKELDKILKVWGC